MNDDDDNYIDLSAPPSESEQDEDLLLDLINKAQARGIKNASCKVRFPMFRDQCEGHQLAVLKSSKFRFVYSEVYKSIGFLVSILGGPNEGTKLFINGCATQIYRFPEHALKDLDYGINMVDLKDDAEIERYERFLKFRDKTRDRTMYNSYLKNKSLFGLCNAPTSELL